MTNSTIVNCTDAKWRHFVLSATLLLSTLVLLAQQRITGVVTNAANQPIPDVSVQVKGSARGTTTNAQGAFAINASETETLVLSSVGTASKEVQVGAQRVINVTLAE